MSRSAESGIVPRNFWPPNPSVAFVDRTTESTPLRLELMRPSSVLSISAVMTSVPEMNATDNTIAKAVVKSRRLRARIDFSATLSTRPAPSVPEGLHLVEDLRRGRLGHLVDDASVGEEDHSICVGG